MNISPNLTNEGNATDVSKDFLTVITVHRSKTETSLMKRIELSSDNSFVPYDIINDIPFIDEVDVETVL